MDFAEGSEIEAKIQNDCEPFCKEVEEMRIQLKNKINELRELGQSIFDDSVGPFKASASSHNKTLEVLHGFDEEDYESLLQSNNDEADITTKINNLLEKHNVDDSEVQRILVQGV